MIRKYPKPVLCSDFSESSLYKESYSFNVKIMEDEHKILNDMIEISFETSLNSSVLLELIKNNKAQMFYKIQTNRFSKLYNGEPNVVLTHKIDKSQLDRIDKIQISLQVVASEDIALKDDDELIDEISNYEFNYSKNELLAISNTDVLNYSLSGTPFINLSLAEKQENKGLLFSSLNNQVIQIKVGPSFNDAYAKLAKKRDLKDVINPFLAFSAILYAIEKAISDKEKTYKEKDWYNLLDQSFESDKYDNLEDFIDSMADNFDVDIVFEIVQRILNNSLETKIRNVARRI